MNTKEEIRQHFLEKRKRLSSKRKSEASRLCLEKLLPQLKPFSCVLSFASKAEEIDLSLLNRILAAEGRLALLSLTGKSELVPYTITNLDRDLLLNEKWKFYEPNPAQCALVSLEQIDCVLVPGVVFDSNHYRLGYGKGHYDRFLSKLACPFYGIGFTEQFLAGNLPHEPYDIPLSELFLF